ncbi:hypothetical protein WJX72_008128 [[Myrmecia] bisecta]|uniref:Kinesin light chain n=1 Tax=[Myrmecia] bisecta TaxID=41462 RepID=A0AAW1QFS6_9CHLO
MLTSQRAVPRHCPVLAGASLAQQHEAAWGAGKSLPSAWGARVLSGVALLTMQSWYTGSVDAKETDTPTGLSSTLGQDAQPSNDSTAQWRIYTDIARGLAEKGLLHEAERYLQQALVEAQKGFGPADPHVAAACNNLADLYRLQHRFGQAEPLYHQCLEVLQRSYGEADVRYAKAQENLAAMYMTQRQLAAAQDWYTRALHTKRAALGDQHADYAATMMLLAECLWAQGRKQDAIALLQQAVEIQDALTGAPAQKRNRLGHMLVMAGRAPEAEPVLRRTLQSVEQGHGPEHPMVALASENLAVVLQMVGKVDEARELLGRSLRLWTGQAGPKQPRVAQVLRRMAEVELQSQERVGWQRAHNLALQAIEIYTERWNRLLGAKQQPQQARHSMDGGGSWANKLRKRAFSRTSDQTPAAAASTSPRQEATTACLIATELGMTYRVLSTAQRCLDRPEEAKRSLQAGIAILKHPSATCNETAALDQGLEPGTEGGAAAYVIHARAAEAELHRRTELQASLQAFIELLANPEDSPAMVQQQMLRAQRAQQAQQYAAWKQI